MLKLIKKDSLVKLWRGDLFRNSSFLAISTSFNALSRFLLVTILARYLSPESYGVWVSITSVSAIMMFGDFGITNALRNKLSHLIANNEDNDKIQREYFFTSFYCFLGFALVLCLAFVLLSKYLPIENFYNTQNEILKKQGVEIFVYIQVTFILCIPLGMANGLFFSYNESKYVAIFNIINSFITLGSVLLLSMVFNANIVILAKVYFTLNLLINIVSLSFFVYKRKWFKKVSIDVEQSFSRIKELLKTGVLFLGIQLSTAFINNIPTIFIAAVVDLRIAASFNIAQKLYSMVLTIYQSVFNPIWSKLALLAAQHKWLELKRLHRKIIIITFVVLSLITVVITFSANFLINIVAGNSYDVSTPIVALLGTSMIFYAIFEATSLLQNALGRLRVRFLSQLFFILTISFIISYYFKIFGILSIPIVLSIIWIILFLILYFESQRIIKKMEKDEKTIL